MRSVVNSSLAETDLLDIWLYTAEEWNLAQADHYIAQLGRSINNLIEHPELGRERSEIRKGYRSLIVNSHIVFYRLTADEIQVIRVLHESVDVERHLW